MSDLEKDFPTPVDGYGETDRQITLELDEMFDVNGFEGEGDSPDIKTLFQIYDKKGLSFNREQWNYLAFCAILNDDVETCVRCIKEGHVLLDKEDFHDRCVENYMGWSPADLGELVNIALAYKEIGAEEYYLHAVQCLKESLINMLRKVFGDHWRKLFEIEINVHEK